MKLRSIQRIVEGQRATDGAGVKLTRVLGLETVKDFDPFLMLDAFDSTDPNDYTRGFPWHPHRGIETITYLICGEIEHQDSIGNKGTINAGCCQWMRAGSGIMHQEMPQASDRMLGLQLWLNMPAVNKMDKPAYNDLLSEDIPLVSGNGLEVRVLSGTYHDKQGPMQNLFIPVTMMDAAMAADAEFALDTEEDDTVFLYLFEGGVEFPDGKTALRRQAALTTAGTSLQFKASFPDTRLVVLKAKPLHEPVHWGGPVVMDTAEGLQQAFRELREGTFIKS